MRDPMTKQRRIPSLGSPLGDWCSYAVAAERDIEQLRAALQQIVALHDRVDLLDAQSIAETALGSPERTTEANHG